MQPELQKLSWRRGVNVPDRFGLRTLCPRKSSKPLRKPKRELGTELTF